MLLTRSTLRAPRPLQPPSARLQSVRSISAAAQPLAARPAQLTAVRPGMSYKTTCASPGLLTPRLRTSSLAASGAPSLLSPRCFSTSPAVGFQSTAAAQADLLPVTATAQKAEAATVRPQEAEAPKEWAADGQAAEAAVKPSAPPLLDPASSASSASPNLTSDPFSAASEVLTSPTSLTATELTLSWWPNVRIMENLLIFLSEHTGAPWWAIIIGTTLAVRVAILPLVIKGQANAARLANIQEETKVIMENVTFHKQNQDTNSSQACMMQVHNLWKEHNCHPLRSFILPATQMPIFISFFFALKALAEGGLDTMKNGGLAWVTDLTAPDPYYIGPVVTAATSLATLETGAEFGNQSSTNPTMAKNMKIGLRVLTCLMPCFVYHLPTSVFFYWVTNNIFSLGQMLVLKIPAVRKYYDIPVRNDVPAPTNLTGSLFGGSGSSNVRSKLGRPMTFAESIRAGFDSQNEIDEVRRRNGELPPLPGTNTPSEKLQGLKEGRRNGELPPLPGTKTPSEKVYGLKGGRGRAYEKWIRGPNANANANAPAPAPAPAPTASSPVSRGSIQAGGLFEQTSKSAGEAHTAADPSSNGADELMRHEVKAEEKRRRVAQAREKRQTRKKE